MQAELAKNSEVVLFMWDELDLNHDGKVKIWRFDYAVSNNAVVVNEWKFEMARDFWGNLLFNGFRRYYETF